jgi:hypothetical protein
VLSPESYEVRMIPKEDSSDAKSSLYEPNFSSPQSLIFAHSCATQFQLIGFR